MARSIFTGTDYEKFVDMLTRAGVEFTVESIGVTGRIVRAYPTLAEVNQRDGEERVVEAHFSATTGALAFIGAVR